MKYGDSDIFQFRSRACCDILQKKIAKNTHLWSLIISKAKDLQKLGLDCNLFVEEHEYFWKYRLFIVLTESNLNSTATLWICQNYYTKPNCTICSRPFFHLAVYMHTHKNIKRMSEKFAVPKIKRQGLLFQVPDFGTLFIYLSPSHNIWQKYLWMLLSLYSTEAAAFCPCVAAKIEDQQLNPGSQSWKPYWKSDILALAICSRLSCNLLSTRTLPVCPGHTVEWNMGRKNTSRNRNLQT